MRTKLILASVAALATLAVSTAASATIVASQSPYMNFGTDQITFTGQVICNFESACASGYTSSFAGGGSIIQGSNDASAAPPGDGSHYATLPGSNGSWTLNSDHVLSNISFFMGSPDTYNSIAFYNGSTLLDTFNGGQFVGGVTNGDQTLGERIYFNFNGAQVNKVVFTSTSNAFEFDNVGVGGGVPEPATWAMMILGMGMVGAGLRMRRQERRTMAATA